MYNLPIDQYIYIYEKLQFIKLKFKIPIGEPRSYFIIFHSELVTVLKKLKISSPHTHRGIQRS